MIDIEIKSTRKSLNTLPPKKIIAAEVRAINKTARSVRTEISKRVRAEVALKASVIKGSVTMTKASRQAKPSAKVGVDAKPIPLKHYAARQVKKGTTVRVKKKGGRKLIKHAFIADKLGSHVFQRKGDDRFPILKRFGPSVADEVERIGSALEGHIYDTLDKQIRQAIGWELEKQARKNAKR